MFGGCFDVPAILQGRKNNRCTRHPQPRPSLHQVWHRRASMFNQDQPRDSKNLPTVLQSQTQALPACCFSHGEACSGGDSKYLGKVHRILLILWFISFGKEKVLSYRIYAEQTGYMEACEPQMYYLRHFSHSKNKFLRRSNDLKYVCGSLARCLEKCVVHFFLLLIR